MITERTNIICANLSDYSGCRPNVHVKLASNNEYGPKSSFGLYAQLKTSVILGSTHNAFGGLDRRFDHHQKASELIDPYFPAHIFLLLLLEQEM
jgi:hypothetical protein